MVKIGSPLDPSLIFLTKNKGRIIPTIAPAGYDRDPRAKATALSSAANQIVEIFPIPFSKKGDPIATKT